MIAALGFAFAAGLVATINPCGFAMLPAYLSYFMGLDEDHRTASSALRSAFLVGGIVSAGFLVVFGVAGLVIAAGFRTLTEWIPWIALGIGVAITLLGAAMIGGYQLQIALPKAKRASNRSGRRSVFGFGVSYGIASLSCTLPVFLVAVTGQLTSRNLVEGLLVFAAYAAGMAIMLLAVTVVLALGKQRLVRRLRASAPFINRASGIILVAAGMFVVWFWTTEIVAGATALGASSAFQLIERIQSHVLNVVADHTLMVALIGLGIVGGAAAWAFRSRRARPASKARSDEDGDDDRRILTVHSA